MKEIEDAKQILLEARKRKRNKRKLKSNSSESTITDDTQNLEELISLQSDDPEDICSHLLTLVAATIELERRRTRKSYASYVVNDNGLIYLNFPFDHN